MNIKKTVLALLLAIMLLVSQVELMAANGNQPPTQMVPSQIATAADQEKITKIEILEVVKLELTALPGQIVSKSVKVKTKFTLDDGTALVSYQLVTFTLSNGQSSTNINSFALTAGGSASCTADLNAFNRWFRGGNTWSWDGTNATVTGIINTPVSAWWPYSVGNYNYSSSGSNPYVSFTHNQYFNNAIGPTVGHHLNFHLGNNGTCSATGWFT